MALYHFDENYRTCEDMTGLSGEYVTFDQNGKKCNFVFEFLSEYLTERTDGFYGLMTLIKRLDKSGGVSFD